MGLVYYSLLWAGCLAGDLPPAVAEPSYLYQPAYCLDDALRLPARPYLPQPGDIVFATDHSFWIRMGHRMAFANAPHHSAIVVALPDGRPALLEAGPFNELTIQVLDLIPALQKYEAQGKVFIRQRRVPLTPEESCRLTTFALGQDGKRFALWRMLAQTTVLRCRGPLRTWYLGKPHGERSSYYCAELVTECMVAAGLMGRDKCRPSATFPRDLFHDRSPNPCINKHFNLSACWYPPARWTSCP